MNSRFMVSSLLAAVVLFVVGGILWGVVFMDFFMANAMNNVMKDVPDPMWAMLLGHLTYGALLTLVIGWAGSTNVIAGMKTAAIVGFLMSASVSMTMFATAEIMNLTGTLLDPVLTTIQTGITGAVIGWWLGRGENAAAD